MRAFRAIVELLVIVGAIVLMTPARTPPAAPPLAATGNAALVSELARELGSTQQQAEGAAAVLFGLAKSRLAPDDWIKIAGSVAGMDGLLNAAPAVDLKPEMAVKAVPVLTNYVTKSGGSDVGKLLASALQ